MSLRLIRFGCLVAVVALASCTPRADVAPKAAPEGLGTVVPVLVGTSRSREENGLYDPIARGSTSFARFDVNIPPAHQQGLVEVGGSIPDPEKHFLTRTIQPMTAGTFRAEVSRQMARNPQYGNEAFVFVHGFNNTMGDGVFRTAQMYSDMGLNALPVHYSWPSSGKPLGYPYDRDSALYARRGLQDLIEELSAAGVRNIMLVAHSMGSHIAMETLRQMSLSGRGAAWNRIGGVALMAPDIDVSVFHSQVADIRPLPQPFVIFSSSRDGALRLSARLTGEKARLGNITSVSEVSDLNVTVIDVSEFRDTPNVHMTVFSSPTFIKFVEGGEMMDRALRTGATVRAGLLPGTILTVQNATEVVLDPVAALASVGQ